MNILETVFNNVVFDRIARHLPPEDVGRVAQTCTFLNRRVNGLSYTYWVQQIGEHREVAVAWLNKVQDPQLSRICYVAFKFFCTQETQIDFKLAPSPVLCYWSHMQSYFNFAKAWEAISKDERDIFYELSVEYSITCLMCLGVPEPNNMNVYVDFIERGLCERIRNLSRTEVIFSNLLRGLCRVNAPEAFNRVLALAKEKEAIKVILLNTCLRNASSHVYNVEIIKSLLNAGAEAIHFDDLLCNFLWRKLPLDILHQILVILIEAGAPISGNELSMFTTNYTDLFDGNAAVLRLLVHHCGIQSVQDRLLWILKDKWTLRNLQILKEMGVDFTSALQEDIFQNDIPNESIRFLLENGAKVNDVRFRFYLACRLGMIQEIRQWPGKLPVDYQLRSDYISISRKTTPAMGAIKNGHIDVVKFLIEQTGPGCLCVPRWSTTPLQAAAHIEDPLLRRKMVLLLSTITVDNLDDLILVGEFDLFLEIVNGMDHVKREAYIDEWGQCIIDNLCEVGNSVEMFEEMEKLIPNKYHWRGALRPLISNKHALDIIPSLYPKYPDDELFDSICRFICHGSSERQSHYLGLLKWVLKNGKRGTLKSLFSGKGVFDIPKNDLLEIYNILFTEDNCNESDLHAIYRMLFIALPPMSHWLEIKKRLIPLQLNYENVLSSLKEILEPENLKESFELARDMIQFALSRGAIRDNSQDNDGNTPLHRAIKSKKIFMALCMIEAKADLDIKNKAHFKPRELAEPFPILQAAIGPYKQLLF